MSGRQPTIVAIGGGGFDSDSPTLELDRYLLALSGVQRPKICLIPTASGDSQFRIARFLRAAEAQDCDPGLLEVYRPPAADLDEYLRGFDVVFVSGGSTRNLLVLWREWGLDVALHRAWESGTVLAGVSAGANCWFEACSTDSNFGELSALSCLGWLPGAFCPHYDTEPEREPSLERMLRTGDLPATLAVGQGTAVRFVGTELLEAVACGGPGVAKRISIESGQRQETLIPVRRLD